MLPIFAMLLPVLILFCGLSIDVAVLEMKQLQMQKAADAGALGAELEWERRTGNWKTIGQQDAANDGFTNGINNVTVNVVNPATATGSYTGRYDAFQVDITQQVQTLFMGALNSGKVTISARSISLVPPCTYFLGTKNLATYTVNEANLGGPANGYTECPQYIHGNLTTQGGNFFRVMESLITGAAGGSTTTGRTSTSNITYNTPVVTDPLASVASPAYPGYCDHTNFNITGTSSAIITTTLDPGVYCGTGATPGMTLWWDTTTLNPGLYIITGGVNWNRTTMSGTGVTLFFTKGTTAGYGSVVMSNLSTIDISAPTVSANGSLAGILIFADRNWVHTAAQDFNFNSGGFYGDGIWYLPNTGFLLYNGTWWCPNYCPVVADNMYFYNSVFNATGNFSGVSGGSPFRSQSVVVE